MKAIAIDDEPLALQVISNYCFRNGEVALLKTFTNPNDALTFLKTNPTDLVFLDIHMPRLSGLDIASQIDQNSLIIFTTAHSNYAVEGFNLNALDYLLKPIPYERFCKAIIKAKEYKNYIQNSPSSRKSCIYVRSDYQLKKIEVDSIQFVEGMDDYIRFHFDNNKTLTIRMTLKDIQAKLPTLLFCRIHRSFIINTSKIQEQRNKRIKIQDHQIPIGNTYLKALKDHLGI